MFVRPEIIGVTCYIVRHVRPEPLKKNKVFSKHGYIYKFTFLKACVCVDMQNNESVDRHKHMRRRGRQGALCPPPPQKKKKNANVSRSTFGAIFRQNSGKFWAKMLAYFFINVLRTKLHEKMLEIEF